MSKKRKQNSALRGSVFTDFSKAVRRSFGLSFGPSADNGDCDPCRLWECCYASRLERIYHDLNRKLKRHAIRGPTWVVNRALEQIPAEPIDWARLSVNGPLPRRSSIPRRRWRVFVDRLRLLITTAQNLGAKWHIPVESMAKARTYRAALAGLGVIVRRTSQARSVRELMRSTDLRSWTVSDGPIHAGGISKEALEANISKAYHAADQIRANGETCVVCPAICSDSLCGQCTACADERVRVVLYPFHN